MKRKRKGAKPMAKWHRREELIGKEIIDSEAKKAGVIRDLAWSPDGRLALIIEKGRAEEAFLPFSEVQKIGDVIFIRSSASLEVVPVKECLHCKLRNPMDAKFCARCGRPLEERKEQPSK